MQAVIHWSTWQEDLSIHCASFLFLLGPLAPAAALLLACNVLQHQDIQWVKTCWRPSCVLSTHGIMIDTDTDTLCCIEINGGRVSQKTRSLSQALQSALQIQANTKMTKAHKDL